MVLSFQCTTTESAQHILKHIDDLKHYIQEQRELIDDSLRLVVWENKLDELCSVIFYAPVKVSTKIDPYFILKNGLTMIGVSELIYIEEIKFSLDTSKRSETNIVYHVDSPEDIGNFESEKFAEQYLRDPVNINLTGLDDEYVELFDEELKQIKIGTNYDFFIQIKSGNSKNELGAIDTTPARFKSNLTNEASIQLIIYDLNTQQVIYHKNAFGVTGNPEKTNNDVTFSKSYQSLLFGSLKKIFKDLDEKSIL